MPDPSEAYSFETAHTASTFLAEFASNSLEKHLPSTADPNGDAIVLTPNERTLEDKVRKSIVRVEGHRDTILGGEPADSTVFGSGFCVDRQGKIATAWHTLNRADSITVCAPEGQSFSAHISAVDKANDLCIVEIDSVVSPDTKGESPKSFNRVPLPIKADSLPSKNERLYGFGYPHGKDEILLSTGTMQAIRSPFEFDLSQDKLQISGENPSRKLLSMNMHIGSGESGGPVINQIGEVVGVLDMSDCKSKALATPAKSLLDLLGKS